MPTINGLTYPEVNEDPNVSTDLKNLATDINRKLTKVVATMSDLETLTDMVAGDEIYVVNQGQTAVYDATARMWSVRNTSWYIPVINSPWTSNLSGVLGFNSIPSFCRKNETVYIKGIAGGGSSGSTIFTLPFGFRPNAIKTYTSHCFGNSGELLIKTNGDVTLNGLATGADTRSVSLNSSFLLF